MLKRKHLMILGLAYCLTATLLIGVTSSETQSATEYDPWIDLNDDGIINIYDVVMVTSRYDTTGTPINKTALLLDLLDRVEALEKMIPTKGYVETASYVIFGEDIDYDGVLDFIYAKNGTTGHVDFSGTDAYTVAQSAIDALPRSGGEIVFRSGKYSLSSFIKVIKNGTTLTSEHAELCMMDNTNSPAIVVGDYQNENPEFTIVDVTVQGFFIDGNRLHQTSEYNGEYTYLRNNCLTFRKAERCSIRNCRLKSARSGGFVSEKHCKYLNIEDSIACDAHFDGFCGYETELSIFNRLTAYDNLYSGFSFDWSFNRNTLYGLIAFNNIDNGIFMDRGSWNIFYGCYMAENQGNGFCFPNDQAGSIVRNGIQCSYIMDNGDCGVYMGPGAEFTFIHGCQILNNPNGGIIGGTNTIDLDNVVA